jgi:hypothetical protein
MLARGPHVATEDSKAASTGRVNPSWLGRQDQSQQDIKTTPRGQLIGKE